MHQDLASVRFEELLELGLSMVCSLKGLNVYLYLSLYMLVCVWNM